jgi:Spy/CpxP family protein refolding chaperone
MAAALTMVADRSVRADGSPQGGAGAKPPATGSPIAGLPRRATPGLPPLVFWWQVESIKKELGLSEDKASKIADIYQSRQKLLAPLAAEYEKETKALDKMTTDRTADDPTYSLQVWRVEALRSKLNESRLMMLYRMYRELQPEQYRKLQEISERASHEDHGRAAGPGSGGGR